MKPTVDGGKWSKNIYLQRTGIKTVEECGGLCLIAANITCQYYVFVSGTCFLGNVGIQNSSISLRTDTQNMYFLNGKYLNIHLNCYLSFKNRLLTSVHKFGQNKCYNFMSGSLPYMKPIVWLVCLTLFSISSSWFKPVSVLNLKP